MHSSNLQNYIYLSILYLWMQQIWLVFIKIFMINLQFEVKKNFMDKKSYLLYNKHYLIFLQNVDLININLNIKI